jgi:uncharacterized protein
LASNEVIKAATTEAEGQGINHYTCKACGHQRQAAYTIAMLTLASSVASTFSSNSSYSSSSSDSSSSSSDSSFGGGDSGGGGSGSDW